MVQFVCVESNTEYKTSCIDMYSSFGQIQPKQQMA